MGAMTLLFILFSGLFVIATSGHADAQENKISAEELKKTVAYPSHFAMHTKRNIQSIFLLKMKKNQL